MKRLNNKGFAITTIVYGLAIMSTMILTLVMSLLATTRQDNNNLSKAIEDELNRFSKTSVIYEAADVGQEFIVPEGQSGWYRIELWGAQGGGNNGGLGAYTSGKIKLIEGDVLYFEVGKQGTDTTGGGATDVRIEDTTSPSSEETRIMVAAGGGVKPGSAGGTLVGYRSSMLAPGGAIQKESYTLPANTTLLGYTATASGSSFGTSTVTTFVESSAGVAAGGRTGLTSLTTAICFFICLFLAPVASIVPSCATAPALIYVGVLMMKNFAKVDMEDVASSVPAFLFSAFGVFFAGAQIPLHY